MHSIAPFQRPIAGEMQPMITPARIASVLNTLISGFSSPGSKATFRYALRRAADGLGFSQEKVDHLAWHTVTADAFQNLVNDWHEEGLSKATIRLYMWAMRALCQALYIRGMFDQTEYLLLKEVKFPRGRNKVGRGRSIERKYRDALLQDCKEDERVQGVRDAALIAILFGSGMRRAEVVSITVENLALHDGEVNVKVKGGDTVTKYLAAWVIPYLQQWLDLRNAKHGQTGSLFSKISKSGKIGEIPLTGRGLYFLMGERSKRAGLPFLVRPHDARRTLGTNMLTEHGDLIAQRVLGHANLSTTAIYDKRSDNMIKDIMREVN